MLGSFFLFCHLGKDASSKKPKDNFGAEGDQYFPGQRRDASYISRLECMKMAVSTHLQRLKVFSSSPSTTTSPSSIP